MTAAARRSVPVDPSAEVAVAVAETLERLEALLEEERAAIRTIDAGRVLALAEEKLLLVESLTTEALAGSPELATRFRALVPRLRENGVLLVHARNAARDLVSALAPGHAGTYGASGAGPGLATGRRLSLDV